MDMVNTEFMTVVTSEVRAGIRQEHTGCLKFVFNVQ